MLDIPKPSAINSIEFRMKHSQASRRSEDKFRSLTPVTGIDLCSNDYLGLARHPLDINSEHYGSTGSRLISGQSEEITDLENRIADFHGFQSALLFSSGYTANAGLVACLAAKNDIVISDDYIHASLIDGIRLSHAKRERFAHNDVGDLELYLQKHSETSGQIFVVVESLYSMDGDFAPLQSIAELCEHYRAALIVDEAHSIGIYGQHGRGLIDELGLSDRVFAVIYTFGKAVGLHGAVICGSTLLKNHLINFCRPFIYTTGPSPHTIEATRRAYKRFQGADNERAELEKIIKAFDSIVKNSDMSEMEWLPSTSPIQALIIPGNSEAKALAAHLKNLDFAAKAILSPTVPQGQERLRLSLHSFNTVEELKKLAQAFSAFRAGAIQ